MNFFISFLVDSSISPGVHEDSCQVQGGGWGWRATKSWEWSVHVALVLVYCPGSVVYKLRGLGRSDGAPSAGQAVRRSARAHRQHSPDRTAGRSCPSINSGPV